MAKKAKIRVKRSHKGGFANQHGLYEFEIHIPPTRCQRSADGRTYLFVTLDECGDQQVYMDGMRRRIRMKLDLRIELSKAEALKLKNRRAVAAYIKDSPILI